MVLIYILLTIIAIGVLLVSEAGKKFLNIILESALVGVAIFLILGILGATAIFFISDTGKTFINEASGFLWGMLILVVLYYGGNYLTVRDKRIKIWKNTQNWLHGIWKEWKGWIIFIIVFTAINLYLYYFA